jgi:DNA repair protein RadA/Sms
MPSFAVSMSAPTRTDRPERSAHRPMSHGLRRVSGMAKIRPVYICNACGGEFPNWMGRCQSCGGWATVDEQPVIPSALRNNGVGGEASEALCSIDDVGSVPIPTGLDEVDRVLGGGLVPGSVTLLSGEPGIGKSTLTLQVAMSIASSGSKVVLVSGEEAPTQVAARARRLGAVPPALSVLDTTSFDAVSAMISRELPQLVVVDSIQTVRIVDLDSAPGSVSQVREVASRLVNLAKGFGVSVLLVGHVTKDGALAGPRLLEHVVDTVLSFNGDRSTELRFLRSVKHRFGPTADVGVFEMTGVGLQPLADPSRWFLADRAVDASGSVIVPVLDGHRPVLVEVQALVGERPDQPAHLGAQGLSASRLRLVLAVLERRAGHRWDGRDVFTSLAGGARSDDPGLDLGVALALLSAGTDRPLPPDLVVCGEIGLAGELRLPAQLDRRLQEAYRLGFRQAVVPLNSPEGPTGLHLHRCSTMVDALASSRLVASTAV